MKRSILLLGVIVFAMATTTLTAQNGGLNIGSLQANESLQVGSSSESVFLLSDLVALPPLTDSEILLIPDPAEGSIVYATVSDVLLVFDGVKWKRADGQNDSYLNPSCPSLVTDIDGSTYSTVLIGTQCWMKENLKVTHYPNGDPIPHITLNAEWGELDDTNSSDAYCFYDNDAALGYGALYTYAAAIGDNWERDNTDDQGICPDGWHLPTDAEWKVLEGTVDTQFPVGDTEWDGTEYRGLDAGTHLKSNSGWDSNGNGDNNSGFTALPGGRRSFYSGTFFGAGSYGYWLSATEYSSSYAWDRNLYYNNANVGRYNNRKSNGFSVRCLRD